MPGTNAVSLSVCMCIELIPKWMVIFSILDELRMGAVWVEN